MNSPKTCNLTIVNLCSNEGAGRNVFPSSGGGDGIAALSRLTGREEVEVEVSEVSFKSKWDVSQPPRLPLIPPFSQALLYLVNVLDEDAKGKK